MANQPFVIGAQESRLLKLAEALRQQRQSAASIPGPWGVLAQGVLGYLEGQKRREEEATRAEDIDAVMAAFDAAQPKQAVRGISKYSVTDELPPPPSQGGAEFLLGKDAGRPTAAPMTKARMYDIQAQAGDPGYKSPGLPIGAEGMAPIPDSTAPVQGSVPEPPASVMVPGSFDKQALLKAMMRTPQAAQIAQMMFQPRQYVGDGGVIMQTPGLAGMFAGQGAMPTGFTPQQQHLNAIALKRAGVTGWKPQTKEEAMEMERLKQQGKTPSEFGAYVQMYGGDLGAALDASNKAKTARAVAQGEAMAGVKPATEGERRAGGYLTRMVESTRRNDALYDKNPKLGEWSAAEQAAFYLGAAKPSSPGWRMLSNERQKSLLNEADWVRAYLRFQSGAVIGVDEALEEAVTFFTRPGDSEEAVQQKREMRRVAEESMSTMSGKATPPGGVPSVPSGGGGWSAEKESRLNELLRKQGGM